MKWVLGSLLTVAIVGVLTLGVAEATPATPRACKFLYQGLVEDYFNGDMKKTNDHPTPPPAAGRRRSPPRTRSRACSW